MPFDDEAEFDLSDQTDNEEVESDEEVDEVELERGYMRQSDYTKKTQEVAQLRRQAEVALQEASEALALKRLVDTDRQAAIAALLGYQAEDQGDDLDPVEQLAREVESLKNFNAEQQNIATFTRTCDEVIEEFGIDATPDDIAKVMVEEGINNPRTAAKFLKSEVQSAVKAEKTNAKKSLGVLGASSRQGAESTPTKPRSIREAMEMAERGISV